MKKISFRGRVVLGVALAAVAAPVMAVHSWSNYHWVRTSQQISPPVGDNVDSRWDAYLKQAVVDWNKSTVIESALVAGSTNPKNCRAVQNTIQACNSTYGNNGWLGLASISLSGGHIIQGTTKLNDTYYNTATYNTPAWRATVTCQEIGHDYGLGHQDEDSSTDATTSCMEYTNRPEGNEHPDSHDYDQLLSIYNHFESAARAMFGSQTSGAAEVGDTPETWGKVIGFDAHGRPNRFERADGPGRRTITHVTWVPGYTPRGRFHTH
jgi:hypothetical protein